MQRASSLKNGQQKGKDSCVVKDLINTISKRSVQLHEWIKKTGKYESFVEIIENAI